MSTDPPPGTTSEDAALPAGSPPPGTAERRNLPRRAAQERFETAFEAHLRGAFDNSPVGMSLMGLDGRFLRVNQALTDMTGYLPDDIVGREFSLLTHPDDVEADRRRLERLRRGELVSYQQEKRYLRKDGRELWVLLSRSIVSDSSGDSLFFFNVVQDITERRRAEEALTESEERFRSIAEAASEAIILADETGMIVSWNPGARRIFKYRDEEVLGRPLTMLMPERYHESHWAGLNRVRDTGRSQLAGRLLEMGGVRKDGEEFPLELTVATWESAGRRFFSGIIRDISERRRAEEALARTTAELQRRAVELERSNAELQQFAYAASHDLAEPLRVVSGYLDLLARRYAGRLDEQADMFINYALSAVDRMQALIAGLLDYARLTAGEPRREEIDVGALVSGVLGDLERVIAEAGAQVEVSEPMPRVRGDATQLGRVFQNLVSNAIKFGRGDRPRVRISAGESGASWCFTVADDGIGIPPEDRARIFAMFERLHSRDEYGGTGLGLAICQRVVERHGGRIWVDEAPEGGSAFRFTIPAG